MEAIQNVLVGYGNIMEKDIVGVQLGCYSVALIGFTIAVRKIRPFSQFKKASDIPNHFIKEKRELLGRVKGVDPTGSLIMIEHKPLIQIPGFPNQPLPVQIYGIKVSGFGINWLQTVVVGNNVKFIPLRKEDKYVQCQVLLPNELPSKVLKASVPSKMQAIINLLFSRKEKPFIDIGESLVKIDFAQIVPIEKPLQLSSDEYYSTLHSAHLYALRKKMGLRYYVKPTKEVVGAFGKQVKFYFKEGRRKFPKFVKA